MGRHPTETLILLSFGEWGPSWARNLGAGLVVTLAGYGAWSLRHKMDAGSWMTLVGPLAVAAVLSLGVGGLPRFFVFCAPLVMLLAAVGGLREGAGSLGRSALLLGVGVLFLGSTASRGAVPPVTTRDVADMLSAEVRPGDCLITEWPVGDVIEFYYRGPTTAEVDQRSVSNCRSEAERSGGRTLYACAYCTGGGAVPAEGLRDPIALVGATAAGQYRLYEVGEPN